MMVTYFTEKSVQKITFGAKDGAVVGCQPHVDGALRDTLSRTRSRCVFMLTSRCASIPFVRIDNKNTRALSCDERTLRKTQLAFFVSAGALALRWPSPGRRALAWRRGAV